MKNSELTGVTVYSVWALHSTEHVHVTYRVGQIKPGHAVYLTVTLASLNMYTVGQKKLHHFIFAITLSKRCTVQKLLAHIYYDKFGTK